MYTSRDYLTVNQIKRSLEIIMKSIDRDDPESEHYYMAILNILRSTGREQS